MGPYRVILVTIKDESEAEALSRQLLQEHLVACVNIVKGIKSLFWWEGKIDTAQEVLLIVKSRQDLFEAVVGCVKKNHSYQVPEIIALPITEGNADYLQWIDKSL